MKNRILKIIEKEKLTPAKFADEIGVNRSSLHHILTERNGPSYDFVVKALARYPKINPDWLLHGTGEMYRNENNQENTKEKPTAKKNKEELFDNQNIQQNTILNQNPNLHQTPLPFTLPPDSSNKKLERIMIFFTDKTWVQYDC